MAGSCKALSFKTVDKLPRGGYARRWRLQGPVSPVQERRCILDSPVMIDGNRRDIGLGSYLDVTLEEARDKCAEHRKQVRSGIDPLKRSAGQAGTPGSQGQDDDLRRMRGCYLDATNPPEERQAPATMAQHPGQLRIPSSATCQLRRSTPRWS